MNKVTFGFNQIVSIIMNFVPSIKININYLISMNYSRDLWEISHSQRSFGSIHIFQQAQNSHQHRPILYQELLLKPQPAAIENRPPAQNIEFKDSFEEQEQIEPRTILKWSRKFNVNASGYQRRKKIKPSPYHNYQKHLNTTLRQLIIFPPIEQNTHISISIASRLWAIFLQSQSETKKILHFIFNQFNQYRIKNQELDEFGFAQTYYECSKEVLGQAKTYLTHMVIDQMNDQNIDQYLQHRRIKNHQKFKRYLMVFKKQLQDGFLKKRFTNRNRKQQIRKQHTNSQ